MNFFKTSGNFAKEAAIKMAKQARQEPSEILKSVKEQVVGSTENKVQNQGPSMMQEVMTGDGKFVAPTATEEQSIHSQAKSRLAQIEAELRQLRMQREQRSQEWVKEQEKLISPPQGQEQKPQVVAPPSRKAHGPQGPGAKKSSGSSMETSRQKKG